MIFLTLITLGLGIAQLLPKVFQQFQPSSVVVIVHLIYGVISIAMYFSLIGLFSAYLATRVVGAALSGHTGLPKLTAVTLSREIESSTPYCGRPQYPDRALYYKDLENRSTSQIARCIRGEIERYLRDVLRVLPNSITLDTITAKITLTLEQSGFFTGLQQVMPLILLSATIILFMILTTLFSLNQAFIPHYVFYYIVLTSLMLFVAAMLLYVLFTLVWQKCNSPAEIDNAARKSIENASAENLYSIVTDLNYYVERPVNPWRELSKKVWCSLGLDKASRCCFAGYVHYCTAANSLVASSSFISMFITLSTYTILLWLAMS